MIYFSDFGPGSAGPSYYVGGKTATVTSAGSGSISLTDLAAGLATAPADGDLVCVALITTRGNLLPASGITSDGWRQYATIDSVDAFRTRTELWAKRMGSTPDTSFQVTVPANSNAYNAIVVKVFRTVVGIAQTPITASGPNSGQPDPASITVVDDHLIVAVGGAGYDPISAFTSSDFTDFATVTIAAGGGAAGAGAGMGYVLASASGAFDPAQFGGGSASGSASWGAISAELVLDDGARTPTSDSLLSHASTTTSGSAFATKGAVFSSRFNLELDTVDVHITPSGTETYKVVVAKVDDSGVITSILGSSSGSSISTTATHTFTLTSPAAVKVTDRIAVLAVRTGAGSTAVCRVRTAGTTGLSDNRLRYLGSAIYASDDPLVSDNINVVTTTSTALTVNYDYLV